MELIFHHVVTVVLPILLCISLGFGLAKLRQPFDNNMVTSVMANVGYPTLILSHLLGHPVDLHIFFQMLLAASLAVAFFGVISAVMLRLCNLPIKAFLSPLTLGNVGNIGLPICALALGPGGIVYGLAFVVVVIVMMFTVSQWVTSGDYSLRKVLTSPVVYSVVLAVVMLLTGLHFPAPIMNSLDIMAGLAIPLMLLTLGYSLATLKLGRLWFAVKMSFFHIVMAAIVAYILVDLFAFSGTARSVFIIQCLMPVAAGTYLWVQRYRSEDAPDVAGMVLVSTLMTIAVLPVALAYWI